MVFKIALLMINILINQLKSFVKCLNSLATTIAATLRIMVFLLIPQLNLVKVHYNTKPKGKYSISLIISKMLNYNIISQIKNAYHDLSKVILNTLGSLASFGKNLKSHRESPCIIRVSPLAILMSTENPPLIIIEQAHFLTGVIVELVKRGFTYQEIVSYVFNHCHEVITQTDFLYAIGMAAADNLISPSDLTKHFGFMVEEITQLIAKNAIDKVTEKVVKKTIDFYFTEKDILTGLSKQYKNMNTDFGLPNKTVETVVSNSSSSSSTGTPTPNPHSDSSADKTGSVMNSVINFVSEHKIAILVGGGLVIATGIIVYVLWKRKGPKEPPNTAMPIPHKYQDSDKSSKELSKNSQNKGPTSSVSQFVVICTWLFALSLCASYFFLLKDFIHYASY